MAHPQQLQFVASIARSLAADYASKRILEVGSYDVNGSIRQFFPNADYLGVDLIAGPGVDYICEGDKIPYPDGVYAMSISCECFEHNPNWAETFINMYRMTMDGGVMLFTCATTGRSEHGTTRTSPNSSPGTQAMSWDYYRNLTQVDFEQIFDFGKNFREHFFLVNQESSDLYFFGVKSGRESLFSVTSAELEKNCLRDQNDLRSMIRARKQREKFVPKPARKVFRRFFEREGDPTLNPRLIARSLLTD